MLSGSRTGAGATSWVNSSYDFGSQCPLKGDNDPWFGVGDADAIEPSADTGLGVGGGGPMEVVGPYATRNSSVDLEDMDM